MAECLTVDQDVAGSTPVSHPIYTEKALDFGGFFLYIGGIFIELNIRFDFVCNRV